MSEDSSKLLINESPYEFQPTLAAWIGLNEAIFLQELHYLLRKVSGEKIGYIDENGVKWYRNSVEGWREVFTFWDGNVIKRTIKNLTESNLIIVKVFTGRCHWFTINYSTLNDLTGPISRMADKSKQRKQARASRKVVSVQNVPIQNISTKCTDNEYKMYQYIGTECTPSKISSKTSSKNLKTPDDEIQPGPLTLAILEVCSLDFEMLSNGTKTELANTLKKFKRKKSEPTEVLDFRRWWDEYDWRGKKGQSPTLVQLCENWKLFISGKSSGEDGKRNGHNKATKTYRGNGNYSGQPVRAIGLGPPAIPGDGDGAADGSLSR